MATSLTRTELIKLARAGAQARIAQLRDEIAIIERTFPDLAGRGGRRAAAAGSAAGQRKPGHRGWSAAQRKAAADRMKKYWVARQSGKK